MVFYQKSMWLCAEINRLVMTETNDKLF